MPNEFGYPTAKASFLTGLLGSTMGYFKQQHDQQQAEDLQRKQMDYQLLMAAMKQLEPNLTPSQAGEIMTRATDIFKPKGHGDIKDRIKEVFGIGQTPYQMQSGNIIQDVTHKPRVQVGTEMQNEPTPSVFDAGPGFPKVTLPGPPMPETAKPIYEQTYREQELADRERLIDAQTERQLAVEERRNKDRLEYRDHQNAAILDRFKQETGIKEDAFAQRKLRERASLFGDPDEPTNLERARTSLQEELKQKKLIGDSKIEYNKQRIAQMDQTIKLAQERVRIAAQKLGSSKAANWNNDPQIKGAWKKVDQYKSEAQRLRTEASILHAKLDDEGAAIADQKAEQAEKAMQDLIDNIENRIYNLNNPVKLPGPPTGRGTNRGGVKLTEAEIRAKGGTDKDVEEARRRGVLAQ